MADKKFLGKIHGEPWDALAKGPREALATIWNRLSGRGPASLPQE